jgi:hypothetical protein
MARLDELSKYRSIVMSKIFENQNLCKALYYPDKNFESKPDIDPYSISYKGEIKDRRIFPYRNIPDETLDEQKAFVNISLQRFRSVRGSFKSGTIGIYILCHTGILETAYGQLRYDYIAHEIDEALNKVRGIGIGQLEFEGFDEFNISNKFIGQYLTYKPVDFN